MVQCSARDLKVGSSILAERGERQRCLINPSRPI